MKDIIKSEKLFFFLLLICSFGIGLQSEIYKYAIIALLLQWLFSFDFSNKIQKLKQNKWALLLIFFYIFYVISSFWSDNSSVVFTDLLLKTPILLFPLILGSSHSLNKTQINRILLVFCLSSFAINFAAFGKAYLNYLDTGETNAFYYQKLTFNMHSAYQAMFTCFTVVLLIYLRIREKFIPNWLMYFGVAVQLVFILLLSSRMQILIIGSLIPFYFIMRYYKIKKLYLGVIYTVILFSFGYLLISQPSSLNYRYKQTISNISPTGSDNSEARILIWPEALQVIKANWLFGVGVGDAKDELLKRFSSQILEKPFSNRILLQKNPRSSINVQLDKKSIRYQLFLKKRYNYHNQYLQTLATIGTFGGALLFIILFLPAVQFIIKKKYLEITFLFIVGASFLTESMLKTAAGVSFISFFYALLIVLKANNKHKLS